MLARRSAGPTIVSDRRLTLVTRESARALANQRPDLVMDFAERLQTPATVAASALARYALFHRAAELYTGSTIAKRGVLARVPAPADDVIARALAAADG